MTRRVVWRTAASALNDIIITNLCWWDDACVIVFMGSVIEVSLTVVGSWAALWDLPLTEFEGVTRVA